MMTPSQVAARRAEWNQRGSQGGCTHLVLELECNEQGYVTGNYVCNFCGKYVAQEHLVA